MSKRNILPGTRTSGELSTEDWRIFREEIKKTFSSAEKWGEAYDNFFLRRIKTRFLGPIEMISRGNARSGEGFAITAIICILIEFLQAFYEGLIYTPGNKNLYEYKSSKAIFKAFLTGHEPFNSYFSQNDSDLFYDTVRCGLLHEEATKGNAKIQVRNGDLLIENGSQGFIVYWDTLLAALKSYLEHYRQALLLDEILKRNFFRKVDELNGLKRILYFAYGSNLLKSQFEEERKMFVHTWEVVCLKNYQLLFNKKSKDNPSISYANLTPGDGQETWGVLYEIDDIDIRRLHADYEGGYNRVEVSVGEEKWEAITFISDSLTNSPPSTAYVNKIIRGAEEKGLPADYIKKIREYEGL